MGRSPTTYPVYVQAKNPWDYENPKHIEDAIKGYKEKFPLKKNNGMVSSDESMRHYSFEDILRRLPTRQGNNWSAIENAELQDILKGLGYDSFYVKEAGVKNLGVYDPTKIKSATGNRGTYDLTDPDITKAKGGVLHMGDGGKIAKGVMGALAKAREAAQAQKDLRVYHGSPHRMAPTPDNPLGKFDSSKLGTGEGGAAYGVGHYLAQAKDVAKTYRPRSPQHEEKLIKEYNKAQSKRDYPKMEVLEDAMLHKAPDEILAKYSNIEDGYTPEHAKAASDYAQWFEKNKPEVGGLYHIDLPKEHIDNMLDWDKPMKNHPPHIKQKLDDWQWSQIEAEAAKRNMSPYDFEKEVSMTGRLPPSTGGGISGDQYYSALSEYLGGRDKASKALQEMGIPGIKYYDEASRPMGGWEVGKSADGKWLLKNHELSSNQWKEFPSEQEAISAYNAIPDTGTRNFVVFHGNEDMAKIVDREKKGGVIHMADAGRVSKGIVGALTKAAEMAQAAKAAKAANESKIADVLASQTPPMTTPQGTGLPLMPRDNGMYTLRDQKDLPRMPMVDKARAANVQPKYNERMQDLLDSPKARKKVDNLINKGKDLNVQEWYGTEPLRQVAMDAGRTPEQFDSMMAQLASASQRNPVDKQNQMGSYLYYLSETGQLPENSLLLTNKLKEALKADPSLAQGRTLVELPKGYGSLAQGDIFNRAVQIGQGDILGALPPNKKLGTFYENLLGNLKPVTVDVNALRGPIIEQGDPRWLTSKLVEKDETGKIINSYKPREMYNTGEMSMREAQQRPGFWEAAPSGSEYAGFEDLWQRGAKRHGVEPAEAQALGWYGSADVTALKTKPENYVDNLERLIKRTAEQTGKSPTEVLNDMVTGKGFLRKEGGAIAKPDWHKAVEKHMKDGGYTFVEPKRMGEGGSSDEPKQGAAFGIYPKPKGGKALREAGEDAGDFLNALGKLTKDQGNKEVESLNKPRATMDIANRGILAPALGLTADMANTALTPLDYLGSKLTGRDIKVSSDKPFLGSEYIKDLMDKYNVTSGEDRPMMETALSLFSPTGMIKGALKTANLAKKAPEAINTVRGGLETVSANAQRPFRPATLTMEAVAPDLGQKGGDKFKDLVTKRMITDEGSPVNMGTLGGQKTEQTPGQGLYENFAGQLETNPMVGITIPRAGNLSTNKRLIADIGTAGQELGQEMVAAHKFTPLLFKNPKDATAMMIGGSEPLTKNQILNISNMLPGMIVTHSPKNNAMFVAPFEGDALDYRKAAQAANEILGKGAKVQFGKADSTKDIMFRGDYKDMGARPPSAESTEMRNRLKKAEERIVRGPSVSQPQRQSPPATLTSTVR